LQQRISKVAIAQEPSLIIASGAAATLASASQVS
jgi:hypothetical protein